MSELTVRRAIFVYEGARLAAIAANAPVVPAMWVNREDEFRAQFLDVIEKQCNFMTRNTSASDLHANWVEAYEKMGWVYGETYDTYAIRMMAVSRPVIPSSLRMRFFSRL